MAFSVQNDSGNVVDANSYILEGFFVSYHADRGNTYSATSTEIEQALVKATDHLDVAFQFVGDRLNLDQSTAWPRRNAEDIDGYLRNGIPVEVKEAAAEYALIALTTSLDPTPVRDETGRTVISKTDVVGPIEESRTFAAGGAFELPKYPIADQKLFLAGLVVRGRDLRRA